ncbi:MAG TPA: FHA domain-containing protein, partial [Gemmata sp.]|nr:FHA domain-containing protein [Gemmata sp.]
LDSDQAIADQHAVITERRGAFYIEPLQGDLRLETRQVSGKEPLGDGDTLELGQGRYVFKCVSVGPVSQSRSGGSGRGERGGAERWGRENKEERSVRPGKAGRKGVRDAIAHEIPYVVQRVRNPPGHSPARQAGSEPCFESSDALG